jgi:hypothetical protein
MKEIKFIKGFGLVLILVGFLTVMLSTLYVTGHEQEFLDNITLNYKLGMVSGVGMGFVLIGGLLRLYSASNE